MRRGLGGPRGARDLEICGSQGRSGLNPNGPCLCHVGTVVSIRKRHFPWNRIREGGVQRQDLVAPTHTLEVQNIGRRRPGRACYGLQVTGQRFVLKASHGTGQWSSASVTRELWLRLRVKSLAHTHKALVSIPSTASKPCMVAHSHYSSIQEVEAGGLPFQGHSQLHSEFKASLGYLRPCLHN